MTSSESVTPNKHSEDNTCESENVIISDSILEAQLQAELETDAIENEATNENSDILPEVPKLLGNLNHDELVEMTKDLKSKNQQLELLLLKAETYSHFITENQKRTREMWASEHQEANTTPNTKKRSSKSDTKSSSKKSKLSSDESIIRSPGSGSKSDGDMASRVGIKQPASLVGGKLMEYQLEGMAWLLSLWENGLSGILADEMGLGKTIQIISLIAYLREHNTPGPYLIAGPLATLPNWLKEFKKWLPSCPVVLYHGTKQDRADIRTKLPTKNSKHPNFPIIITSYEIIMADRKYLERYSWEYLILDEGQRIKNKNCKLLTNLKKFKSVSRILLSGTPIQNTLEELWSLLNFCSPMIFDDYSVFQSWFGNFKNIGIKENQSMNEMDENTKSSKSHKVQTMAVEDIINNESSTRIISKLHEILRPFLLRRLKKDIPSLNIPIKREIIIYCAKTSLQKTYYEAVLGNGLRDMLLGMGVQNVQNVSQLNMCMNLRKVCNHPFLFGEPIDQDSGKYITEEDPFLYFMASGKVRVLDRILNKLLGKGKDHKVLIFSQMTELLNILEDYAAFKNYKYCRLDGSTKIADRQAAIEEFNSDPIIKLFFISTRAGGLGINLTAADTVILFDSDWNPHQDAQAQDRCHRIGQTKPVVTYRLVTTDSVEISMLEKQVSKKKLERLTIQGGDFRKAGQRMGSSLTISKLRQLLEDDVKNLDRKFVNEVMYEEEISEEELGMILNRNRLFALDLPTCLNSDIASSNDQDAVPLEGKMYDIVLSDAIDILQAM